MNAIRVIIFDWGNTLMYDFPQYQGPMVDWPEVQLLPKAAETLKQLQGKYRCCVASNAEDSNAALVNQALQRVGIDLFFEQVFTSKELGWTKPEPQFYLEIASRLGISPQQGLMVGNSYEADIQPAKQAGMMTIWLTPDKPVDCSVADAVIKSLAEIPSVIEQLLSNSNK